MALHPSLIKEYLLGVQGYKGGKAAEPKAGQRVYKLSSNENPIGPSPKAVEAIKQASRDLHIYPDNTPQRLYDALGRYYKDLDASNFVAGNSGSEMIELLMTAFIREGDEIIVSSPSFLPYEMFGKWRGAHVKDVPLKQGDFSLDVDGILRAITERTRLIFLTTPNNPTGTYIPKKELDRIIASVPEHLIVVIDEVYYRFADAPDYTTALPYVLEGKSVIGINSFSKSYGLAGMRLGYMYTTAEIAAYIRNVVRPFLINSLSLSAAIAALEDEEWVEDLANLVKEQKKRLYPVLDELDIRYWNTQGNFVLVEPEMGEIPFSEALFREGIMTRPVASFGAPGCVRITIGDEEATDALINALRKVKTSPLYKQATLL